ncbi:Gfo/Idh/MocA family protein [Nonomuraea sp. NPDC050556]|uniref:Gfo/Idh/MocA family protein n=1 Tax=Nonomuraea sp. NPDC050556 TaxID=3364369 RepID=UPI00379B7B26
MSTKLGIVGASGWAAAAHLPALAALPEFEVAAVATTRRESADRVAAEHGVRLAFTDAAELVAHPEVELVVVSVRASGHAKLIRSALEHGKDVLSEWPLGVDAAESAELAGEACGVRHGVMLQGCVSPDAAFVADLVAGGRIGRLESATLVAAGDPFGGASIPDDLAWTREPGSGTTLLSIMAGHFLATFERTVGRLTELSARLPGAPDQVLVHGTLECGAAASVSVLGGSGHDSGAFFLKLVGSDGVLTVTPSGSVPFIHWSGWRIEAGGEVLAVPGAYRTVDLPTGPAANVAALYRAFATGRQPGFDAGARLHGLLASIERAAASGGRVEV